MKLRYLLILGLSSLVMVGCVPEVSKNQANENPIAVNASVPVSSTQAKPLANSAQSPDSTAIKSGTFVSGEQKTQGKVSITTKDGKSFIELDESFKTSESGPDLVVILHRSDNVINSTKPPSYPLKNGDYFILAPLQKYSGAQTYAIPQNINLADYKSIAIWCRKFNATFGAASLSQ
ncbi:DM13 domain-containing protein [Nostoc sp. UCD121]|uniref:DM13 domain-containing protein n=1 Tax=unclassified Nostoc TaxID=2593658 RepID=UPI00162A36DC|nr:MULTISPECIES: DM13 domain-containing protein [unclassified Nostoc]MBC1222216.1 DM13 domain-containing protein [Nostoc sp. UCD120]MBC1278082.1 DM13 domain-containing protein [Nostoc sp. UCD121]MBC1299372.1 DM13 domain-containing protein [Nostoc sp. UCD122]